ncbi:MAG TPA: MBL fold metallo-hydrolase [Flavobacterium sp.]|nr:MBL fold metallo-hydrolase [Flavobacterium sp.]
MNTEVKIIDLNFQNTRESIGSFLINTSKGPVLIETGPEATYNELVKGIEQAGFKVSDIHAVLLTHIHFDHAGAAWKFAQNGTKIYVHEIGLPHLANPEKLWNSAAQIYGEDMERLWGKMEPIPKHLLIAASDGDVIDFGNVQFKVIYTPGHAIHHNAYQWNDSIFTGDVAGCKIENGPVVPPCPPPDINIELWKQSLQKLRDAQPKYLYLTHFARHDNPMQLLDELETELDRWSAFIKPFYDAKTPTEEIIPKFMKFTSDAFKLKGLTDEEIQVYEYANPSWMSVNGLLRYWKLKDQGRI